MTMFQNRIRRAAEKNTHLKGFLQTVHDNEGKSIGDIITLGAQRLSLEKINVLELYHFSKNNYLISVECRRKPSFLKERFKIRIVEPLVFITSSGMHALSHGWIDYLDETHFLFVETNTQHSDLYINKTKYQKGV